MACFSNIGNEVQNIQNVEVQCVVQTTALELAKVSSFLLANEWGALGAGNMEES